MKKVTFLLLSFALALSMIFSAPAQAFMMLQLNIEQLTALAGKIFVGRCLSVSPQTDAEGRKILEITYQVTDTLKGDPESRVTFYQMSPDYAAEAFERKGVKYSSLDIPLPSYEVGEENLIFLGDEGSAGLTAPIGMDQGKFVVKTSRTGEKRVVNGFGNSQLFKETKRSPALKSLSLTGREKLLLNARSGDVSLEEISGLVKKIAVQNPTP